MLSNKFKIKDFYKITKRFLKDYDPNKDYYKILGITKQATDKEIKIAYYKLAKQYHPDVNQGKTNEKFKEMSAAYDILSDPNKRKEYDASRSFNSFFSGTQYSSNSTSSNYNKNQYNYRTYEDPFRNMNDFFRNFYQKNQQQQSYKSNFNEKPRDFKSKYYSKNKDYFSTFKAKEDDRDCTEDKPKKGGTNFSKKYFDKNKKYYETFKKNDSGENRYNTSYSSDNTAYEGSSSQSGALYFILTFFGIFMGSIIVHSLFSPRRQHHNQSPSYQQPYKPAMEQAYQPPVHIGDNVYMDPYANTKL